MEHSPVMRYLMMVSWFVTALVSINMLTGMYDYNFIIYLGNMMPGIILLYIYYISIL